MTNHDSDLAGKLIEDQRLTAAPEGVHTPMMAGGITEGNKTGDSEIYAKNYAVPHGLIPAASAVAVTPCQVRS